MPPSVESQPPAGRAPVAWPAAAAAARGGEAMRGVGGGHALLRPRVMVTSSEGEPAFLSFEYQLLAGVGGGAGGARLRVRGRRREQWHQHDGCMCGCAGPARPPGACRHSAQGPAPGVAAAPPSTVRHTRPTLSDGRTWAAPAAPRRFLSPNPLLPGGRAPPPPSPPASLTLPRYPHPGSPPSPHACSYAPFGLGGRQQLQGAKAISRLAVRRPLRLLLDAVLAVLQRHARLRLVAAGQGAAGAAAAGVGGAVGSRAGGGCA